ncbi:dipeptidase E [Planomicrobium soli]|uniref:Dipeptidase E n=1 Tax=Planomicrobium soli TaxID=1176648 RepID=A0A2P8GG91_9BACL|nr:Type 1 glutamine amidotransferase-like domain-containing protein [Planomicrobium soli]PSL32967.1 dipeptidase E [Planomicrobium soli]
MVKLFISGGGDEKQGKKFDQEFAKRIDLTKPLLYIPIAMKGIISSADCYQWVSSVFKPLGIDEIIMWTDLNNRTLENLKQFSAVYIGGGNTFSLLNDLRTSKFDVVLKEFIKSGGILYGGSAGAIILGSNIMTCAHLDHNDVKLRDCNGLNLIHGFDVWCHMNLKTTR